MQRVIIQVLRASLKFCPEFLHSQNQSCGEPRLLTLLLTVTTIVSDEMCF